MPVRCRNATRLERLHELGAVPLKRGRRQWSESRGRAPNSPVLMPS
jgi:hypothetical protein